MSYFGLPWSVETIINAVVLLVLWLFMLFKVTIPVLATNISRWRAQAKAETMDEVRKVKEEILVEVKEVVGNPTDLWVKSGFFSDEHAALLGKPVEYMVEEDGVEKKVQDGVWTPARIITESVGKSVEGVLTSPKTREVLNHIARNQVMMITEKFGDNVPLMREYEQALVETAVEEGLIPQGEEFAAFYAQNRVLVDKLFASVAPKIGLDPEDVTGSDAIRLYSAAKNSGLLDRLQKSGGNTPRSPAPYRPKKASTGAGIR